MITIKVDAKTLEEIEQKYNEYIVTRDIGYIIFVAKTPKNIITAYENKKGINYKVTIQGENHIEIAKKYCNDPLLIPKKKKENKESLYYIDVDDQIGSDEVGTGDFFGPIVVCAAYVNHDTMKLIEEYKIRDSKKFTDEKILEIIPLILKKVHYNVKILDNDKFNSAFKKGLNTNKIKCILHNNVLTNLHERCPYVKNIYIDQFCDEESFYSYLNGVDPDKITKNIIFKEKGETYFPSVALASCIARYFFLTQMEFNSKKLGEKLPLGAGKDVDEFARYYKEKYGMNALEKICKVSFKNYKQLADN